MARVTWALVMTAFDARPVRVAVSEMRALMPDHTQYRELCDSGDCRAACSATVADGRSAAVADGPLPAGLSR